MTRIFGLWALTSSLVLMLSSCGHSSEMNEYAMNYAFYPGAVDQVPVILVGFVAEGPTPAGRFHRARYDSQILTRRYRIKVTVENVLQGEVKDPQVDIYFFSDTSSQGGSGTRFDFRKGDRYIFFLQRDYGELRTLNDTYSNVCLIKVFSGAHPAFRRDLTRPLWDSMTELLLTRGSGADDQQMVKAMDASGLSRDYAEAQRTINLDQLARDKSPVVRSKACLLLRDLHRTCP